MIHTIFGSPATSWFHFLKIAEHLSIPVVRISQDKPLTTFSPPVKRFVGDFRLVHVANARLLTKNRKFLENPSLINFVLVSGPESLIKEAGIPLANGFSTEDFIASLAPNRLTEKITLSSAKVEDAILERITKDGLLGELHSLFYRIPDKSFRDRLRKSVYAYLAGVSNRKPKIPLERIRIIIDSPFIPTFRSACMSVASGDTNVKDHPGLDPFEIMYVLKKSGSL